MNLDKFKKLEDAVREYPDNKAAWERACDMMDGLKKIRRSDVDRRDGGRDFYSNIYPQAVRAAEIIHVMSTVPVYILIQSDHEKGQDVLAAVRDKNGNSILPVFFDKASTDFLKGEIEKLSGDSVRPARIPFMFLIDKEYGAFDDESDDAPKIALCDTREGRPWLFFNKSDVMACMLDASRALRSHYDLDLVDDYLKVMAKDFETQQSMMDEPVRGPGGSILPLS